MIKGNQALTGLESANHANKKIKQLKRLLNEEQSPNRVNSDESCDFFSDNLSEAAAGAVPENCSGQQSNAFGGTSKRHFHLFVFVHGFQASS